MGVESLLLESGAVLAAGLVIALYNELLSRSSKNSKPNLVAEQFPIKSHVISTTSDIQQSSRQTAIVTSARYLNTLISEAPEPFADESFSTHKTPIPTDVTAVPNIGSTTIGTGATFVIPIPKRKRVAVRTASANRVPRRKIARTRRGATATLGETDPSNISTDRVQA